MARIAVTSSSRVTATGSRRSAKTKITAVVPLPRRLTAGQIGEIREAFRKAGIGFECTESGPDAYEFTFETGDVS